MTYMERLAAITQYMQDLIIVPGHLSEVRGLRKDDGMTVSISAICDNAHDMARWSIWMDERGYNTYHTVNPISPQSAIAEIVRRTGRMNQLLRRADVGKGSQKAAKDSDIAYRRYLFVDIDPVRAEGCDKLAASEAERKAAHAVAQQVGKGFLATRGWGQAQWVGSGNGYQALYPIASCSDHEAETILRYLAHMFDTCGAHIDTAVSNPSRIARTPYTINRKGEPTEERPWRMAVPGARGEGIPATSEMVAALAREGAWCSRPSSAVMERRELVIDADDVQDFIDSYDDVLLSDPPAERDGKLWWDLHDCPFIGAEHEGQDLGGGRSNTAIVLGPDFLGFRCLAGKCSEHTFGDLVALLEERTGRKANLDVYAQWDPRTEAKWGGVDDVTQVEQEHPRMSLTTPQLYELTWREIADGAIQVMLDELEDIQDDVDLHKDRGTMFQGWLDGKDVDSIARYLGHTQMRELKYAKDDPPIDARPSENSDALVLHQLLRVVERGRHTCTA